MYRLGPPLLKPLHQMACRLPHGVHTSITRCCSLLPKYRTVVCISMFPSSPKSRFKDVIGSQSRFSTAWQFPVVRDYSSQVPNPEEKDSKVIHGLNQTILQRLASMEDSMRVQGYSMVRVGLSILAVIGVCIYVFREYIRENVADEVSTVATMSLTDTGVQMKVQELAMALIQTILNNEDIQQQTVQFLSDVFQNPAMERALTSLLTRVLSDPSAQSKLTSTLKHILQVSLSDAHFREQLAHNLRLLLEDDNTKQGLLDLLQYALGQERLHKETQNFVDEILASSQVRNATARLGKEALGDILVDKHVQKQTGDAMWSAFTYSVTPRLLGGGAPAKPVKNTGNEKPDLNPEVADQDFSS